MSRTSYHHGNLPNALEDAAVELARAGGPDAVVLREVARRAGVSPTAAYRHFAGQQDLLERVKHRALAMLAERTAAALAAVPVTRDRGDAAVARLLAAGRAYVDFARSEPGCFATAFRRTALDDLAPGGGGDGDADGGGIRSGGESAEDVIQDDAFSMLGALLDDLVTAGRLPARARPDAEYAAWSAVHGVAVLILDGPMRHLDPAAQDAAAERTFRLVIDGLTDGATRAVR